MVVGQQLKRIKIMDEIYDYEYSYGRYRRVARRDKTYWPSEEEAKKLASDKRELEVKRIAAGSENVIFVDFGGKK